MEPICKLKEIYKVLYTFEKGFAENNGITINEAMVLCCMKDGEPKAASQLCEFVGLSNSRVSRVINTMESKGFISREMGLKDKRQMIFTLTNLGLEKIKDMQSQNTAFSSLEAEIKNLIE